jgi:hypothetical protein
MQALVLVAHCKALEARGPIASHSAGPPGPAALLLALEGRASVAVARRLPAPHQHPHRHQQHQEWINERPAEGRGACPAQLDVRHGGLT